jgi:hypothetical protein
MHHLNLNLPIKITFNVNILLNLKFKSFTFGVSTWASPNWHTRSLQSFACQLRLQIHISYAVHFPWPLHPFAHSAFIVVNANWAKKSVNNMTSVVILYFQYTLYFNLFNYKFVLLRNDFSSQKNSAEQDPLRQISPVTHSIVNILNEHTTILRCVKGNFWFFKTDWFEKWNFIDKLFKWLIDYLLYCFLNS